MNRIRGFWTDQRGEGGVSGGAMVAIVILVVALIAVVIFFMGGFGGSSNDADIQIDVDPDLSAVPGQFDSGLPT